MLAVVGRQLDAGNMVASKLDSSNTMTMCGSLRDGSQAAPVAGGRRSAVAASASSTLRVARSMAASAPDRANLETILMRVELVLPVRGYRKRQRAKRGEAEHAPDDGTMRRTRNGSMRHSSATPGSPAATASATFQAKPG